MSGHGKTEITDPVEEMLKRTGCIELHYKVQECIAETQDWRKCQLVVSEFRKCMQDYESKKQKLSFTQ
ncbi:cytochrome c oxidase assembly factor 4 homolog, mitochondrial [Coccinella septempunctata]|uniref:cytochrome c oxidase assembly factor 4 homolog, mitochondrial n=1 Tax=Coccinella septempunctata TaxID=41139 RepID=UPI001D0866D4|nr:cytochrome c oxidase assembly factor 4 homolog, mitochondrial [Coccinella septempunctata]